MAPEEVAAKIIESHFNIFIKDQEECSPRTALRLAKQHALKTIDEIIRIAPWGGIPCADAQIEDGCKEFYFNVKEEIEKL